MFSTLQFTPLVPPWKHSVVRAKCSIVSVMHHFSVVGRSRSKDHLPQGQHLVCNFLLLTKNTDMFFQFSIVNWYRFFFVCACIRPSWSDRFSQYGVLGVLMNRLWVELISFFRVNSHLVRSSNRSRLKKTFSRPSKMNVEFVMSW